MRCCRTDLPFTHILKPAGTSGFEQMPVVEWLCLELGRMAGLATAQAALIAMPRGMPPALVIKRFDIRENGDDPRWLAMEDVSSILGVLAKDKHKAPSSAWRVRSARCRPILMRISRRCSPLRSSVG